MNVLVACEESQRVCIAFRERGHRAFSCDIQECSGGHPEWHIQGDVLPLLNGNCTFQTADTQTHAQDGRWDLIIAHPPCTYLTVAGNSWFDVEKYGEKAIKRLQDREDAVAFFMRFATSKCNHIAIENPVGVISTRYRKPDQIIQPFMFGHPYTKQTCLWLKGLPILKPTDVLQRPPGGWENEQITEDGRYGGFGGKWGCNQDGKWYRYGDPEVSRIRSRTFPGVASAMADQWGDPDNCEIQLELEL